MQNNRTKTMVMIAMMTAVLSILSILQIPGPTGVPWTLQVFAVALCGYVLGWKGGAICVVLYMLLGLVGVPVYSGMTAGPGILFGVAGGFIFGFIFQTICCGFFVRRKFSKKVTKILVLAAGGILGAAICELCGAVTIHLVGGMSYVAAVLYCFVSFFPLDALKTMLALFISLAVRDRLVKTGLID